MSGKEGEAREGGNGGKGGSNPDAVVVGFDRTVTYDKLSAAAYWISQGIPYLATHPDRICPTQEVTHAVTNDVDAVDTVKFAKNMIVNQNAARVSVSAGALWEVNGVLASPMSAGVLPIPIPTNIPGGPVTSALNVISDDSKRIAVANYLRLVSLAGTSRPIHPS